MVAHLLPERSLLLEPVNRLGRSDAAARPAAGWRTIAAWAVTGFLLSSSGL